MILSDGTLRAKLYEFIDQDHADYTLVNPASIDIRIGKTLMREYHDPYSYDPNSCTWEQVSLPEDTPHYYYLAPGEFVLVETLERLRVPNGYALELKLKSSRAREGYNHSLAFWFDPGWDGIGTMEIHNMSRYRQLPLWRGMRFGQIVIHQLDAPAINPYAGRYNYATGVEPSKG